MTWYDGPWGAGSLMSRSLEKTDYEDEATLFLKFKGILNQTLQTKGQDFISWCLRHGIEVTDEIDEIAPVEAFIIGYRTWQRLLGEKGEGKEYVLRVLAKAGIELDDKIVNFIVRIGDRVPVSHGEDLVYLFPRDFVDKALLFNMMPD